ncbi:hypothetical protein psal_cds_510 [Pandoravirus salinus]|uniref:Ankyrin repeat domain containing protein n=1 Tax=Pandoravirus salinus TaxID=1349410 RepID=S4VVC3_9VIRU|nr:hypothetical protein psal_cds_510 [Pandoravirus salinus]AGO84318.1 hypothetical protein psal_cds_510 [Pandoravirus salinus]
MEQMPAEAPILVLPPEAMAAILDRLGHADFCRARAAHPCFRVHSANEVWQSRRVRHWLRLAPETVCKAGRADILAFLYARRRVPRAIRLIESAAESGHTDVVRVILEDRRRQLAANPQGTGRTSQGDPHALIGEINTLRGGDGVTIDIQDAIHRAARCGHADIVRVLIAECGDDDQPVVMALGQVALQRVPLNRRRDRVDDPVGLLVACAHQTTVAKALLALAIAGATSQASITCILSRLAHCGDDMSDADQSHAYERVYADLCLQRNAHAADHLADQRVITHSDAIALVAARTSSDTIRMALTLAARLPGRDEAARFLEAVTGVSLDTPPAP